MSKEYHFHFSNGQANPKEVFRLKQRVGKSTALKFSAGWYNTSAERTSEIDKRVNYINSSYMEYMIENSIPKIKDLSQIILLVIDNADASYQEMHIGYDNIIAVLDKLEA